MFVIGSLSNLETQTVFNPDSQHEIQIPNELKSINKNSPATIISEYSKENKGYITILFGEDGKPITIYVPKSINKNILINKSMGDIRECYQTCVASSQGGSESHPWLCYFMCVVEEFQQ